MKTTQHITLVSNCNGLCANITLINNQLNTVTATINRIQDLLMSFNNPSYTPDVLIEPETVREHDHVAEATQPDPGVVVSEDTEKKLGLIPSWLLRSNR